MTFGAVGAAGGVAGMSAAAGLCAGSACCTCFRCAGMGLLLVAVALWKKRKAASDELDHISGMCKTSLKTGSRS